MERRNIMKIYETWTWKEGEGKWRDFVKTNCRPQPRNNVNVTMPLEKQFCGWGDIGWHAGHMQGHALLHPKWMLCNIAAPWMPNICNQGNEYKRIEVIWKNIWYTVHCTSYVNGITASSKIACRKCSKSWISPEQCQYHLSTSVSPIF